MNRMSRHWGIGVHWLAMVDDDFQTFRASLELSRNRVTSSIDSETLWRHYTDRFSTNDKPQNQTLTCKVLGTYRSVGTVSRRIHGEKYYDYKNR